MSKSVVCIDIHDMTKRKTHLKCCHALDGVAIDFHARRMSQQACCLVPLETARFAHVLETELAQVELLSATEFLRHGDILAATREKPNKIVADSRRYQTHSRANNTYVRVGTEVPAIEQVFADLDLIDVLHLRDAEHQKRNHVQAAMGSEECTEHTKELALATHTKRNL